MKKKLALPLMIAVAVAAFLAVSAHFVMRYYVATPAFHQLVVQHLTTMLGVEVQVGRIESHFFNRVTLSRIHIIPENDSRPLVADVDSISFRYSFFQFLTRQLQIPSIVSFESPSIILKDRISPSQWMNRIEKKTLSSLTSIRFNGGNLYYPLPGLNSSLVLKNLRGGINVTPSGVIDISVFAMAQNFLEGEVRFHGKINPHKNSHSLGFSIRPHRAGISASDGIY